MGTPISIHQRSYQTEAFDEGDGVMRVMGRLVDTKPQGLGVSDGEPIIIHDMVVNLFVRLEDFEIQKLDVNMNVHPYGTCPSVLAAYQQMVGVSIARGYSRRVKELFGGPNGCSHIGALLIALGPVAIQASWSMVHLHEDPLELAAQDFDSANAQRQLGLNENTCHVWQTGGEQLTMLSNGERPVRPTWETDRLVELSARRDRAQQ